MRVHYGTPDRPQLMTAGIAKEKAYESKLIVKKSKEKAEEDRLAAEQNAVHGGSFGVPLNSITGTEEHENAWFSMLGKEKEPKASTVTPDTLHCFLPRAYMCASHF